MGLLAGSAALYYNLSGKTAEADEKDNDNDKTFFQKNVMDYKQFAKEEFKIP
jgi:hypothetical protein